MTLKKKRKTLSKKQLANRLKKIEKAKLNIESAIDKVSTSEFTGAYIDSCYEDLHYLNLQARKNIEEIGNNREFRNTIETA